MMLVHPEFVFYQFGCLPTCREFSLIGNIYRYVGYAVYICISIISYRAPHQASNNTFQAISFTSLLMFHSARYKRNNQKVEESAGPMQGSGGPLESGDKGKPFVQSSVAVGDEGEAGDSSAPPRPAAATGEGSAPVDDGGLVRGAASFICFCFCSWLFVRCHVLREGGYFCFS